MASSFARPADSSAAPVIEAVLCGHLLCPRHLAPDESDDEKDNQVDDVVIKRKQRAAEQREMDEPACGRQKDHIADKLGAAVPGARDRPAGKVGSPARQDDRYEEELPER